MNKQIITVSRRGFLGAAAATAAVAAIPPGLRAQTAQGKPNSNFNGVQIGVNTYSYHGQKKLEADKILGYLLENGLSSVELKDEAIFPFIKRPKIDAADPDASQKWLEAADSKETAELCAALRKMYEDAGVKILTSKLGDIGDGKMPDGQIEYYFKVAKALGSKIISRELGNEGLSKRLGPLADKHKIYIAYHNHTQINAKTYDGPVLSHGEYLAINLDIGHYVAANDDSVVELIEKFNKRIVSLHIKDRKLKANGGTNMPFGEGDTPVAEALNLIRKNKYPIVADIELEYPIPKDSTSVKEVTKCVAYCKKALS